MHRTCSSTPRDPSAALVPSRLLFPLRPAPVSTGQTTCSRSQLPGFGFAAVIGVHGNEQIGAHLIGDRSPTLERDERIVTARVNHFQAETLFQKNSEALCDLERKIFLQQALAAYRAHVPTAVSGVDHDAEVGNVSAEARLFGRGVLGDFRKDRVRRILPYRLRVQLRFGRRGQAAHLQHEAKRIGLEAHGKVRAVLSFQFHTADAGTI